MMAACLAHSGDSVTLVLRPEALQSYPKQLHLESPFGKFDVDISSRCGSSRRRCALDYGESYSVGIGAGCPEES